MVQINFIDIKMCFKVIGNYSMNFRPGPIRLQTHINFPGVPKRKMETLVFSLQQKHFDF